MLCQPTNTIHKNYTVMEASANGMIAEGDCDTVEQNIHTQKICFFDRMVLRSITTQNYYLLFANLPVPRNRRYIFFFVCAEDANLMCTHIDMYLL